MLSAASGGTLDALVPAYFYPGTGGPGGSGDGWANLATAAAQIGVTAILNPNSGPQSGPTDQNYVTAMTNLENAGGKVIAYIPTDYTRTKLQTVVDEANTYIAQYGSLIQGFFVDEMTDDNVAADIAYYHNLYTDLKGLNAAYQVIGNPGTAADPGYLAPATQGSDVLVTYEDDDQAQPYSGTPPAAWTSAWPATDFANIVYNEPIATTMLSDVATAPTYNAAYVYVTEQTIPNPYGQLPVYWSQEITAIANSAASLDTPGLGVGGPEVTYNTGGPPVPVTPAATLYTGDGAFANASLTVSNTDSGTYDRLGIQSSSGLSVSGSTISYNGTSVGTFQGGASSSPLTVRFNGNATQAAILAVVQNLTFKNIILNPAWLGSRVVDLQLTDGSGNRGAMVAQTIVFVTPPVLAVGGPAVTYNTGGPAIRLAPLATLSSGDGAFANSSLAVTNTDSGTYDRLGIQSSSRLSVSGSTISYNGTSVGTFQGGASSTPLLVRFNGNATQAAVLAVAQNLTFKNVILNPAWLGNRTIDLQLTDTSGNRGAVVAQTIVFVTPPVLAVGGPAVTYNTGGPAVRLAPLATLSSGDGAFANSSLTVTNTDSGTYDRLGIQSSSGLSISGSTISYNGTSVGTFQGGASSSPLTVSFNVNATQAAVLAVAQNLTFINIISNPSWLGNRVIGLQLIDGSGNRGAVVTQTLALNAS